MTDPAAHPPVDPSAVDPASIDPAHYPRKVLFVAGAGRSGTSTMAGLMQILGLHVPQPEVVADETNPKGFGEPAWAVEHHDRLLKDAGVQVSDARPDAWFETGRVSTREQERITTAEWLEGHFGVSSELVVKDPRLAWFLSLWRVAAVRTGATPVFATMLRPPAEVVGSKQTYYKNRLGSAHLAASWLNMLLHTERATRASVDSGADGAADGSARVFVRYADLLDDWTRVCMHAGETLGLQHVLHARSEQIRDGHRFVDPSLRRVTQSLEDLALPRRLHDLTAETWAELNKLADPGGDTPQVHQALDQLREAYVELYEESEAISRSSVVAAEQRTRREVKGRDAKRGRPGPPAAQDPRDAAAPERALADRIPHGVRAAIPPSVRRGLRKAAGKTRP
ncbi:sulfotransferase family protein [Nocardioides sp. SYSU DS0663]|uniref:sulfotransferase family protein n=1 Tax=Nocardioides sp. SYSU DS0663 TaxID=3416445 RepID=UPI003F4B473C